MEVGILGATGPAGRGLAVRLASVGMKVGVGSRSLERARGVCDELARAWPGHELPLVAVDNEGAAEAGLVVVATPWDAAAATASSVADHLAGKVVVSMANALKRVDGEMRAQELPHGSVAAAVQAAVPDARVAAAFHHLAAKSLSDLRAPVEGDVLVCADDEEAAAATAALVSRIPDLRPLRAGSLAEAGPVEAFTAVILNVNARYRTRAAIRLTGIRTAASR